MTIIKINIKKKGTIMKSKWELTRYLIDAKKNVDSMWFIADNMEILKYLNLRKKSNCIWRCQTVTYAEQIGQDAF